MSLYNLSQMKVLLWKKKHKGNWLSQIHLVKQQQVFNGFLFRTTRVSHYQEGKTNLDLLEQEIVSGNGICWAIGKSAPLPR